MESIAQFLFDLDELLWGTGMTVILIGVGIILSIRFRFHFQIDFLFNLKNTYGRMFEKKPAGEGTISSFKAACTALANTIGTGNISGVATAIVSGGPGALFWMWVSAFFGISTKACEIIIGQRYREHYRDSMDEYVCDRSFALKNALGWKKSATVLALFCFTLAPWTLCVQTEAVVGSLKEAYGLPGIISVSVIGLSCLLTIWGGLRSISASMAKAVPIMSGLYILMGLGVIIIHFREIPDVISLILISAFSPTAAVGGFAGATVKDAIQYGVARGIYSNDAGTGYDISAHASAITDHPVRQSLWGFGEVFLDTMIICSITALTIILTGSYITSEATSSTLTTIAFTSVYGPVGGQLTAIAVAVLAWTTIIGMYYSCEKSVNYAFGDTPANRKIMYLYKIYYLIPCVIFFDVQADVLWALTDILSAVYVGITLFILIAKHREIFRLFDDFYLRFLPAINRGEQPKIVSFDCKGMDEQQK